MFGGSRGQRFIRDAAQQLIGPRETKVSYQPQQRRVNNQGGGHLQHLLPYDLFVLTAEDLVTLCEALNDRGGTGDQHRVDPGGNSHTE